MLKLTLLALFFIISVTNNFLKCTQRRARSIPNNTYETSLELTFCLIHSHAIISSIPCVMGVSNIRMKTFTYYRTAASKLATSGSTYYSNKSIPQIHYFRLMNKWCYIRRTAYNFWPHTIITSRETGIKERVWLKYE